jgi:hypothetical protein
MQMQQSSFLMNGAGPSGGAGISSGGGALNDLGQRRPLAMKK